MNGTLHLPPDPACQLKPELYVFYTEKFYDVHSPHLLPGTRV